MEFEIKTVLVLSSKLWHNDKINNVSILWIFEVETKYRHGGLSLNLLTLNQVTAGYPDKSPIVLFINQTH